MDFLSKLLRVKKENVNSVITHQQISIVQDPTAMKHYREGEFYYNQGNYVKAVDALRQGISIEPVFAAYVKIGDALSGLGRFKEAANAYELALEIDDSNLELHNALASTYMNDNRWDEALDFLTKKLESYQNADLYFNLGCVYSAKRMYDQAIEAQRRALTFNPQDVDALYNLGIDLYNKYLEENDSTLLKEAIATLERCLSVEPNQTDAQTNLERLQHIQAASLTKSTDITWTSDMEQRPSEELEVGDIITLRNGLYQYQIKEIKRGGMGVVYIARNLETHELNAIKTFQGKTTEDQSVLERFAREAETWVKLDVHPNVVTAEYVERIGDRLYILLDYIDGTSLRTWIAKRELTLHQILDFAIQFCAGMNYAYQKLGLIHRDIKPENILITRNGIVKVTDFGLAKTFVYEKTLRELEIERHIPLANLSMTHTGAIMGTLPYMSPEQFIDAKSVNIASDIYAFGVVLYEMFTCRLPFRGHSPQEYRQLHLSQPPRPLGLEVPAKLEAVVLRCLNKSAEDRPSDFEALQTVLIGYFWEITGERYVFLEQRSGEYRHTRVVGYSRLIEKGQSLRNLNLYEEAIECFRRAARLNPDRAQPWIGLVNCYRELGLFNEAIEFCDRALEIEPDNSGLWNVKGVLYLKIDHEQDALACFNHALTINPHEAPVLINKAVCLKDIGRYEEALTYCDKIPETDQDAANALNNKATILWLMGRHKDALSCVDKALAIDPDHTEARVNKRAYEFELADLRKTDQHKYKEWNNHGLSLLQAEQYQSALECFDEALKIDEKKAEAWAHKAYTLSELEDVQQAIHCYEEALSRDESLFDAWFGLGNCFFDQEQYEDALHCYERAIHLQPDDLQVLISKGSLLANMERYREALDCFNRVLSIAPEDETVQKYQELCRKYLDERAVQ